MKKEAATEFVIDGLEAINNVALATVKNGKISVENAQHWLESVAKSFVVIDEKSVNSLEETYKTYISLEKEAINSICTYMYDKQNVYQYIRGEFSKAFGIECKFENKTILKEIVKATFAQFKGDISQDLQSMRDNSALLLDLEFHKWIREDKGIKRADESLIAYLPKVLRFAATILNHNKADAEGVYPAKTYQMKGTIISKNSLNEFIKGCDDMQHISHTLEGVIKAYNDAYNINSRFNKALKGFDKEKLIELFGLITPDSVDALIKEYKGEEVA